jgi:YHS domain-containing protein
MNKILTIVLISLFAACSDKESKQTEPGRPMPTSMKAAGGNVIARKFTPEMIVNKKDYSCGMPVTAGIEDTCHYKGKAYGFCSKECKEEFLKDPDKIPAAMDGK